LEKPALETINNDELVKISYFIKVISEIPYLT